MLWLVTALLVMVLFGKIAGLSAEPLVNENYVYYDIEGDSDFVLLDEIERVRDADGFHAQTTWHVKWVFDWQSSLSECVIIGTRIDVNIEYLLPRWLDIEESRNPGLVDNWHRYKDALLLHEHGHGDIAVDAGREVETALLKMRSYDDCDRLSADANALAMDIVDHHQMKNDRYDQVTDHGVTQGAVFP